ncbi:ABC transporter family substrate-binding protein [Microtetraspora fusca]|uniref:ABC transporter family substrate-binding protein n=1 Tax=Microtetraspora fusca TaxID=1997 RepID=A0ABW6V2N6_MICFU|nr:ABC transporter family substrate-binding protein [Microtetraspora fusca]
MSYARRTGKFLAVATGAAILLTACGSGEKTPAAEGTAPASNAPAADTQTITHAHEQEIGSYNNNTSEEYSSKDAIVLNRVLPDVWYFGADGSVQRNTDMATYEKVSDSPLTVKYTFNPNASWSDGQPIGCADVLLTYATGSGKFPDFSFIDTEQWPRVEMPDCKVGDKEVTLKYKKSFVDWEAMTMVTQPAHIVAEQGGLTVEQLVDAIKSGDKAKLKKAAQFYNKGWLFNGKLPDKKLMPSSGQFLIDSYSPGQSITLARNENYWGEKAKAAKVVIRFIPQDEQVQALQNGETNIIEPQSNPDVLAQLNGLSGVTVKTGDQFLFDHLDFNFNKGPFKDDINLRKAFALCVPRQQIVDNLIKPQNPQAAPMDVRNIAPFQPGYAEAVSFSGGDKWNTVDIEGAKKLLGGKKVKVRIGYNQPNPRRTQVVELIKASCDQAGFDIEDTGSEKFFDESGDLATGNFDVALFGWSGSALNSGWTSTYSTVKKCTPEGKGNNKGCYSNKEVDKLTDEMLGETDPAKTQEIIKQIEKILWDDLATIPLYSQPALAAWSENLANVQPNPSQASITWNMHQWAMQ